MVEKFIALQRKLVPELIGLLDRRYTILQAVALLQPVGRRALSTRCHLSERIVRGELEFLEEQGWLRVSPAGMMVTPQGEEVLTELEPYIHHFHGLYELEKALAEKLRLQRVMVVPGNADEQPAVKENIGRTAAHYLKTMLRDGCVVAVNGGTTMAAIANAMVSATLYKHAVVVPARGGLGEGVEIQANTIAARLAQRIGASYRLLHVPDNLRHDALVSIAAEPQVKEVIELARKADILLHGIGRAEEMARRRNVSETELEVLKAKGAVGEAFGYYFTRNGEIVHVTPSIGFRIDDLGEIPLVITACGGESKATAILAVTAYGGQDVLITDEGAARKILSMV